MRTAELIAAARSGVGPVESPHVDQRARGQQVASVPIHSLRRPGVVARQETILSGAGESLTIVHDTVEPALAYAAGIRLALAAARDAKGVIVGLDSFLDIGIRLARRSPGTGASARRGRRARAGRARHRRMSARIGVAVMAVLLALYIVLVGQRAWLLLTSRRAGGRRDRGGARRAADHRGVGARTRAVVRCPRASSWDDGSSRRAPCPQDAVAVRPSGRVLREDADAVFPAYRADVEAHPEDWRAWYRLGLAYDGAGDRRRAREAVRRAIRLESAERRGLARRRHGGSDRGLDRRVREREPRLPRALPGRRRMSAVRIASVASEPSASFMPHTGARSRNGRFIRTREGESEVVGGGSGRSREVDRAGDVRRR